MAFVSDTFTDTDAVTLQTHTPNIGSASEALDFALSGTASVTQNGEINTNRARSTSSTIRSRGYRYPTAPANGEIDVEAVFVLGNFASNSTQDQWFVAARMTPTGTSSAAVDRYYAGYIGGTSGARKWVIGKVVAGTVTELVSSVVDASGTKAIKFEVRDAAKKLFVDGVEVLSTSDNAITQVGRVGFNLPANRSNANYLDTFSATDTLYNLIVQDATHGHTTDAIALTQDQFLAVQDSTHATSSDSPALTQDHQLVVQDASHGTGSDSPTFTQGHVLSVADGLHGHTAEEPTFTQLHVLSVDASVLSHTAEELALTQLHQLSVQDSAHEVTSDNVVLLTTVLLAIQDALHGHLADNIVIVPGGPLRDVLWIIGSPRGTFKLKEPQGTYEVSSPRSTHRVGAPRE